MKYKKSIILVLIIVIIFISLLSIMIGTKTVDLKTIINALTNQNQSFEMSVVQARIPRTLFGIVAGASLALSGCLMQSITRNPIADPSILGVNTGASLFVVSGIAFFSISNIHQYIWLGFIGSLLTALFVYAIASSGVTGVTPIKLALSGAATSIALSSLVNTIMLPNSQVMESFRFWQIGSIAGASFESLIILIPYFVVGLILAFSLSGHLNTLALGDELASGLGMNTKLVRAIAALAGVLLCGATTALAGPIGFVGLMVPHLIRLLVGSDMNLLLPLSALGGSILLLFADIIGRIVMSPSQLEVGIVTALLGAPVFIVIVKRTKVKSL